MTTLLIVAAVVLVLAGMPKSRIDYRISDLDRYRRHPPRRRKR